MLRIGDHESTRTPQVEIAQVVQRPMGLLVSIGHMTTTRTRVPLVIAAVGNNLWLGQVGSGGHPFAGIGSIRTRTEHGFVLLVRMLGPALYDKCPSGTIPKPGKDAIVSKFNEPVVLGKGEAFYFPSDKALYIQDLYIRQSPGKIGRIIPIQKHTNTIRLWKSFEKYLRKTFPEAQHITTPLQDTSHGSFTALLRSLGYKKLNYLLFQK